MSFDISPFETKQIPIRGIQPFVEGNYDGYLSVTLNYNDKTETFNLYLSEINVTAWRYDFCDVCKSITEVNSSIEDIKRKL